MSYKKQSKILHLLNMKGEFPTGGDTESKALRANHAGRGGGKEFRKEGKSCTNPREMK
jgi:hypothetical protein